MLARNAGKRSLVMLSEVQPCARCIDRIGRGAEKRKIWFFRTAVTSLALSVNRAVANGAIFSADIPSRASNLVDNFGRWAAIAPASVLCHPKIVHDDACALAHSQQGDLTPYSPASVGYGNNLPIQHAHSTS
jgi:hypothetical protein